MFWKWGSRRSAIPPVAVGYILMVALLRDGAGGSTSGFGGLFYLPIIGVALMNRPRTLLYTLFLVTLANVLPILIVGDPQYPTTNWRGVVVQLGVGSLAGFTLQGQVAAGRARLVQLRQLDRMKDEFLSLVSHELRTPLTSIRGYVELLPEDAPLSPTQSRFVEVIQRNVTRLATLVEDLLFVARLDEGRVQLTEASVDVAELLRQAADTAQPMATGRNVGLTVDARPVPAVRADRERLAQMIDNLVANAVKFTPEGGTVTLRAHDGDGQVHVEIADTGIGIPPDELERLFERFFRASTAREEMPGTGLGLAISQSIAEAHGTRLEVESEVGRGTTFSFSLAAE
ncbi:MAG TPA: ATP-binding protein [Gaiellaceae bacterium]|nr:ATP-binding protein [Gaiellaceae bacterium]